MFNHRCLHCRMCAFYATSPAAPAHSDPNELHNSGVRALPPTPCAARCTAIVAPPNPRPALVTMVRVFYRRAPSVAMVHISLVTMVRVSTQARRQPANHASTHPKITMVMNKGTMVTIYRGERTYPTTTNRGTTHTPLVTMVRITFNLTRPTHKPPAYTSKSKRALHPESGLNHPKPVFANPLHAPKQNIPDNICSRAYFTYCILLFSLLTCSCVLCAVLGAFAKF